MIAIIPMPDGVSWSRRHCTGAFECEEVTMTMVTDIQHVATVEAVTIEDVELPGSEVGLLRPDMRHDANLRVVRTSSVSMLKPGKRIQEEPGDF
jgi:hypothetical protein